MRGLISSDYAGKFPNDPIELQGYDAVILANVPRGEGGLNDAQETMLAQLFTIRGADW